jgi:hypothetical protein
MCSGTGRPIGYGIVASNLYVLQKDVEEGLVRVWRRLALVLAS